MKKLITTSLLFLLIAGGINIRAQQYPDEYLGLPGDNLNLYAVMDMFRESETLEGFERNLNDNNSRINNLDLNGDNFVDYIMVTDFVDGDDHNIVLSVAINRDEKQDVAVFTVNRFRNGAVQIQLIGDEELYGKNYIIEPIYDDNSGETPNPGYKGNNRNTKIVHTTTYEVAAWPMMLYIYQPNYVIWRSGWYYGYYPSYWHSWSPSYYHYYYGYYSHWYPEYYKHYRHWNEPRYQHYNTFYYSSVRSHSPQVNVRIKGGNYNSTYSHPESRREGEKKGFASNPAPNRRSDNNKVNTRTNASSGQNKTDSRRSTGETKGRSASDPQSSRREDNHDRSSKSSVEKSVTTPAQPRRADNPEKSSGSATVKSATKPEPAKKADTERRQEKPASTAKPAKSSTTKSTKTESSSRKSETKTETTTPTRRK